MKILSGFSKNESTAIKGFLAITILLFHISNLSKLLSSNYIINFILDLFGYLSPGFFFFLSGYGLYSSYLNNQNYVNTFKKHRIFPFYIKYFIGIALYTFLLILLKTYDINMFFNSFFIGETAFDFSWFLQVIIIFYWLFYFSFKYSKNDNQAIVLITIGIILYILYCLIMNFELLQYCSVHLFLFGILYKKYCENKEITSIYIYIYILYLL